MAQKRKSNALSKFDQTTVQSIDDTAKRVFDDIQNQAKPELKFPLRALS
ncbi:MAG: hypothetical protein RL562_530, partial [Planctomycetota bacterium]